MKPKQNMNVPNAKYGCMYIQICKNYNRYIGMIEGVGGIQNLLQK